MTNEDYSKVPPPHLLKKFSEQARVDSQKRGHPGYCKTFAKLCIDWAFQEAAMDDYRAVSAEVSGAASQPESSSGIERRSGIVVTPELIEQWRNEWIYKAPGDNDDLGFLAARGAQYGADEELEACCEYIEQWVPSIDGLDPSKCLRAARRPKPPSLKEQALKALNEAVYMAEDIPPEGISTDQADTIRRALEQLDD